MNLASSDELGPRHRLSEGLSSKNSVMLILRLETFFTLWITFLPLSNYGLWLMPLSLLIWPKSLLPPPVGPGSETRHVFLFPKLLLPFLGWLQFPIGQGWEGSLCISWSNLKQDLWILSRIFMLSIPPWNYLLIPFSKQGSKLQPLFPSPAERLWPQS